MTTEPHTLTVSGLRVAVVRKAIRNLHLGVYPPDGRVRVAAPLALTDAAVRVAVISRLPWIRRQQAGFERQDREPQHELVSGESHYVLGRRYLLDVVPTTGAGQIVVRNRRTIELHARPDSDARQRERTLRRWHRDLLHELVPPLLHRWERRLGVEVAGWSIKRMKTRWGGCNADSRRIWLNPELARKPPACLEYLVVHELVHLLVRHHDARFDALMDRHLPRWRSIRRELNSAPLAHDVWEG